jgi:hypothetical protein
VGISNLNITILFSPLPKSHPICCNMLPCLISIFVFEVKTFSPVNVSSLLILIGYFFPKCNFFVIRSYWHRVWQKSLHFVPIYICSSKMFSRSIATFAWKLKYRYLRNLKKTHHGLLDSQETRLLSGLPHS